jgi:hypothetical protein
MLCRRWAALHLLLVARIVLALLLVLLFKGEAIISGCRQLIG